MGYRGALLKSGESRNACLFDVDFTPEGSKVLAGEVVPSIEAALAAKKE